jgi:TPR repeat protein
MKTLVIATGLVLLLATPAFAQMSTAPKDLSSMESFAMLGDSNAQLNLGKYYATPHNAAPDFEQAAKWYRKAADQGNAEAQYRLGDIYYTGKGHVKQSYEEAYFWFLLAAKTGPKAFAIDRNETEKHLTSDQIEAIKKRVDDWKPVSKK